MTTNAPRQLIGEVVSNRMTKTVVVRVDRFVAHPKYHKRFYVSQRYKAHAEDPLPPVGARVVIEACRPYSKEKRWRVRSYVATSKSS